MRYPRWKYFQGGSIGGFLGETLRSGHFDPGPAIESEFLALWFDSLARERPGDYPAIAGEWEYLSSVFPLILRWHEQASYYRQQLIVLANNADVSGEVQEIGLIWGSALATLILELVPPKELLTYLINCVSPNPKILLPIAESIERGTSYGEGRRRLLKLKLKYPEPLLALYGFLMTPDDMEVCLRRSRAVEGDRSRVPHLTGIISGLYNSISGVPASWRLQVEDNPTVTRLMAGAERMYRSWCGIHGEVNLDAAIASPGIIQPRRGIKVISQRES